MSGNNTEEKKVNEENEMDAPMSEEVKEQEPSPSGSDENTNYLEQLQRLQAEFINYKRRMEKMQSDWADNSVRNVISELLPVMDDFDYLFLHNTDDKEHLPVQGVKMIYDKMFSILEKLGLETVATENVLFDPEMHEAVRLEKTDEAKPGEILQVWQRGYQLKGRLIRPARVMVAEGKESEQVNE